MAGAVAKPISPEAKQFGKNLRASRKSAGFSQEGFALHCGLDRSYVGQIERGEKNVTLKTIVTLAEALETTADQLVIGVH